MRPTHLVLLYAKSVGLSAMLFGSIGLGGAVVAQQVPDTVAPEAVTPGAMTPGEGIPEKIEIPSRSVTTSQEPYGETMLGGRQADAIIGMSVVDANGVSVGEVSDLLIGTDNEIDRAIVDVGGFLGLGTKPVAIAIDELTIAEGDGEIVLDHTREALESMPEWQSNEEGWFTE